MTNNTRAAVQRRDIRSNDPLIRELLEAVAASSMTDQEIMRRAGCNHSVLSCLRTGATSTRLLTFVSLAEVVGMQVRLQSIGEDA